MHANTLKILFVDDDDDLIEIVQEVLRVHFTNIKFTSTSKKALELLQSEPFDLLITDLAMPLMDGAELGHIAKQLYPQIKVYYLTGFCECDLKLSYEIEPSCILYKPVKPEIIIHLAQNLGHFGQDE